VTAPIDSFKVPSSLALGLGEAGPPDATIAGAFNGDVGSGPHGNPRLGRNQCWVIDAVTGHHDDVAFLP
jgi:hypothetical protein